MVFLILSLDPDFVAEMKELIESRQGKVFWATSEDEAERLWAEGIFEMVVWDPFFWGSRR